MLMDPEKLAHTIVEDLFTTGSGETAQRLVLTVDRPVARNLGGWSQAGAYDRVLHILLKALKGGAK